MSDQLLFSSSQTYQQPPHLRLNSHSHSFTRAAFQKDVSTNHRFDSNNSALEELVVSPLPADGAYSVGRLDMTGAQVSMADRELAERTTSVSDRIQQWYAEVSSWEWPAVGRPGLSTGFEVPTMEERASKRRKLAEENNAPNGHMESSVHVLGLDGISMQEPPKPRDGVQPMDKDEEYWGGCPAWLVKRYQNRIEAIMTGIAALELEDLQTRVLDVHMPSRTGETQTAASVAQMDDVTALTTGTLLQVLPYLAKLSGLLDAWSIRLSILRIVPYFLQELGDAQIAMQAGWDAIGLRRPRKRHIGKMQKANTPVRDKGHCVSDTPRAIELNRAEPDTRLVQSDLTIDGFKTIEKVLSDQILSAGQRLDRMLDTLEGREDSLPREWIQELEQLEEEYTNWVCEARRVVLENELRQGHAELKAVRQQLEPSPQKEAGFSQASDNHNMMLEREVIIPDEKAPFLQNEAQTLLSNSVSTGNTNGPEQPVNLNSPLAITQARNILESTIPSATEELRMNHISTNRLFETQQARSAQDTEREEFPPPRSEVSQADISTPASDAHLRQTRKDTISRPKSAPPHAELSFDMHQSHRKGFNDKMTQSPSPSKSMVSASTSYPLMPVNDVDVRYNILNSKHWPRSSNRGHTGNNQLAQHLPALKLKTTSEKADPQYERDLSASQSSSELSPYQRDPDAKRPAAVTVDPVKEIVTAPSSASSYHSDLSSPELQDAFAAVVGKPVIVTSRPTSITGNLMSVENQELSDSVDGGRKSKEDSITASLLDQSNKSQMQNINQDENDSEEDDPDMLTPRRASLVSIAFGEVVDKASVKSIEVRKRRSQPAMTSSPSKLSQEISRTSPRLVSIRTGRPRNSSTSEVVPSLAVKDVNITPTRVNLLKRTSGVVTSRPISDKGSKVQLSSKGQGKSPIKETPLNTTGDVNSGRASYTIDSPAMAAAHNSQDISREEQLEQKISSILTTIPAQIRLTSEDEPGNNKSSKQSKSDTPLAPHLRKTPTPSSNSYTLSPAKPQSSRTAATENDHSEVKLYHLRRGGVDASTQPPIKLLIRLVGSGNNERVMVRVGGGWSELGDYLRDYAIHHNTNRRSISDDHDGIMEVKKLHMTSTSSTNNTPLSRQHNISREKENGGGMTPASSHHNRIDSSKAAAGQWSSRRSVSSVSGTPITPSPNSIVVSNTATPASITASTNRPRSRPDGPTTSDDDYRPKSSSTATPEPKADGGITRSSSTRNSGKSARPISRGGSISNNRLSAEKQAWVEAMIGRVKRTTTSQTTAMTTISNPSTPITNTSSRTSNKNHTTSSTTTPTNNNIHQSKSSTTAAFTPFPTTTTTNTTTTTYMDATISTTNKNSSIDTTTGTNPSSSSRTPSRDGLVSYPSSPTGTADHPSRFPAPPMESFAPSLNKDMNVNMNMDLDLLSFGDLGTVGRGGGRGSGSGVGVIDGLEGVAGGTTASHGSSGGGGAGGIRRVFPRRQPSSS